MPDGLIDIPAGGLGRQFARALALYSYVLHRWSVAHGNAPMGAIAFDKLVTLVSRLWEELASRSDDECQVDFPIPFRTLRGKHGPGRGVFAHSGKTHYVGTLFATLEDAGLPWLMSVDRPLIDYPKRKAPANHPRTKFKSGLVMPEVTLRGPQGMLCESDWAVACEIASAVACLDEEEIRYLGTHSTAEQTYHAIIFELDHWDAQCAEVLDALSDPAVAGRSGPAGIDKCLKEAAGYAGEAQQKCKRNEKLYSSGRANFLSCRELGQEVRSAFTSTHHEPDVIWRDQNIRDFVQGTQLVRKLSDYLAGAVAVRRQPSLARDPDHRAKKGIDVKPKLDEALARHGRSIPPLQFWADGDRIDQALADLRHSCEAIKGSLPVRPDRRRCRRRGNPYRGHLGDWYEGYSDHAW